MRMSWETFRIGSHVDESEFSIIDVDHESDCIKYYKFGAFACLNAKIVFKRNIGKYFIKRLIPSFIIVLITFIGFWIPTNIAPARTVLPITALLALITQQIQSDLNVSYVYALQVWNIVCIVFVFANLLEYAIALYIIHTTDHKKDDSNCKQKFSKDNNWKNIFWNHFQTTTRNSNIDIVSRYLFPTLFVIFIIIFSLYVFIY